MAWASARGIASECRWPLRRGSSTRFGGGTSVAPPSQERQTQPAVTLAADVRTCASRSSRRDLSGAGARNAVRDGGLWPAGASRGHDTHRPHAMAPGLMSQTIEQTGGHPQDAAGQDRRQASIHRLWIIPAGARSEPQPFCSLRDACGVLAASKRGRPPVHPDPGGVPPCRPDAGREPDGVAPDRDSIQFKPASPQLLDRLTRPDGPAGSPRSGRRSSAWRTSTRWSWHFDSTHQPGR
jgi:hypothetical protein